MHFERINGRLNRRVRTPGFDEWQGLPGLLRRLAQLSFSGQRHQFQLLFQSGLIRWSMEALVKAANAQLRKALARLRHYLQRHLIAALLLHHLMVQDELMLVFEDAYLDPQFDRHTGLPKNRTFVQTEFTERMLH